MSIENDFCEAPAASDGASGPRPPCELPSGLRVGSAPRFGDRDGGGTVETSAAGGFMSPLVAAATSTSIVDLPYSPIAASTAASNN
jgi:hypothetical protein